MECCIIYTLYIVAKQIVQTKDVSSILVKNQNTPIMEIVFSNCWSIKCLFHACNGFLIKYVRFPCMQWICNTISPGFMNWYYEYQHPILNLFLDAKTTVILDHQNCSPIKGWWSQVRNPQFENLPWVKIDVLVKFCIKTIMMREENKRFKSQWQKLSIWKVGVMFLNIKTHRDMYALLYMQNFLRGMWARNSIDLCWWNFF